MTAVAPFRPREYRAETANAIAGASWSIPIGEAGARASSPEVDGEIECLGPATPIFGLWGFEVSGATIAHPNGVDRHLNQHCDCVFTPTERGLYLSGRLVTRRVRNLSHQGCRPAGRSVAARVPAPAGHEDRRSDRYRLCRDARAHRAGSASRQPKGGCIAGRGLSGAWSSARLDNGTLRPRRGCGMPGRVRRRPGKSPGPRAGASECPRRDLVPLGHRPAGVVGQPYAPVTGFSGRQRHDLG